MTHQQANPASRDRADGETRGSTQVVTQRPHTTATDNKSTVGHYQPNDQSDADPSNTGHKTGTDRIDLCLSHKGV